MPKRYLYTVAYMRKVESVTKDQLQISRNWTRYCRRWLGDWMCEKEKKTLSFSFFGRKWMFFFVFGCKWNFIFVGILDYGRKWKMLFGRHILYITKRSWSWDAKSWSWSWTLGLVLVLKDFKSWLEIKVLVLVLKESLDYVTIRICNPNSDNNTTGSCNIYTSSFTDFWLFM